MKLKNKNIILGVTGSIAAYKACDIVRLFVKSGANVTCIVTENALKFVTQTALRTLSKNAVHSDMFEVPEKYNVEHISLADSADIIVIAPATANVLSRLAAGAADDLLTSTVLASTKKVLICPAMNANMWAHKATQKNVEILKSYGYFFVMPGIGELACGATGAGRLADLSEIVKTTEKLLS
jgi:phosphopantothenoylcysteine synthetase/decarboxylase